jgi:hypothetical protein
VKKPAEQVDDPEPATVLIGKHAGNWAGWNRTPRDSRHLVGLHCSLRHPPRVDAGEIDLNLNPALIDLGARRSQTFPMDRTRRVENNG